jgi:hypothetical protein
MDFDPDLLESKLNKVLEAPPPDDVTPPPRSPSLASTDVTGALNDFANRAPLTEEEKARRKQASDRAYELTFGEKPPWGKGENGTADNKSPSLASTSSGAFQYHQSVYREPPTEEEQAREDEEYERYQTWAWGERVTQEQEQQRNKARERLGLLGWCACDGYKEETSKLTALRNTEDGLRSASAEAFTSSWSENNQQALECQRQQEDHRQFAKVSSIFLTGDEDFEDARTLRYRLKNLTNLLEVYDSQWQESIGRLQKYAKQSEQSAQEMMENEANDPDFETDETLRLPRVRNKKQVKAAKKIPDPVNSSKPPKASGKGRIAPRQATISKAAELKSSPSDGPSKKNQTKRLSVSEKGEGSKVTPSANTSPRVLQPRSGREVVGNVAATGNPAKPQGVLKNKRTKKRR